MPLDQTARLKAREQGYLTVTDWSGRLESCYGLEGWVRVPPSAPILTCGIPPLTFVRTVPAALPGAQDCT